MSFAQYSGKCRWARLTVPDTKYGEPGKYTLSLGLDAKQFMELQKLKIKNSGKLDENGIFWVNFNRKADLGKPKVLDKDGNPVTDLIGNDSSVTVEVEIKSWTDKKTGSTQYAATLVGVRVDDLIKYAPNGASGGVAEGKKEEPSPSPDLGKASSSLPIPKRMF